MQNGDHHKSNCFVRVLYVHERTKANLTWRPPTYLSQVDVDLNLLCFAETIVGNAPLIGS